MPSGDAAPAPQRGVAQQHSAKAALCLLAHDGHGVLARAGPVAHDELVTGPPVGEGRVRVASGESVLHEQGCAAADGHGVLAVSVPVADVCDVVAAPVGEGAIGLAARQGVSKEVDVPAADAEGGLAVAVPVAREAAIRSLAVGNGGVGRARGRGVVLDREDVAVLDGDIVLLVAVEVSHEHLTRSRSREGRSGGFRVRPVGIVEGVVLAVADRDGRNAVAVPVTRDDLAARRDPHAELRDGGRELVCEVEVAGVIGQAGIRDRLLAVVCRRLGRRVAGRGVRRRLR